ncbi:hypothetical protein [Vulcanisaeta sp. JCM 16159]|uniref:hypothetical protein n=1 Tax=Vulcanisaeta sp. JCM 16159 TaxID=1295371 RepID=UPI001FB4EC4C|nr:hypothetical protein [Vulcanisaeta sp. JCM 16159]
MSFEKINVNRDIRHWLHTIEQGYRYTAGPIGTKFLEALRPVNCSPVNAQFVVGY